MHAQDPSSSRLAFSLLETVEKATYSSAARVLNAQVERTADLASMQAMLHHDLLVSLLLVDTQDDCKTGRSPIGGTHVAATPAVKV